MLGREQRPFEVFTLWAGKFVRFNSRGGGGQIQTLLEEARRRRNESKPPRQQQRAAAARLDNKQKHLEKERERRTGIAEDLERLQKELIEADTTIAGLQVDVAAAHAEATQLSLTLAPEQLMVEPVFAFQRALNVLPAEVLAEPMWAARIGQLKDWVTDACCTRKRIDVSTQAAARRARLADAEAEAPAAAEGETQMELDEEGVKIWKNQKTMKILMTTFEFRQLDFFAHGKLWDFSTKTPVYRLPEIEGCESYCQCSGSGHFLYPQFC